MGKKIEDYLLQECIGKGNYGEVFKATHPAIAGYCAVKVIPNQAILNNPKTQQCLMNEVTVLSKMGPCKQIVRFYQLIKTKNNHYFVYQYCNGGTLEAKIRQKGSIPEKETIELITDLLNAFKVLNKFNVLHRDLKPENILFHNGSIKLADFGLCKGLQPEQSMTKTMLGSPIYMAPEVLKTEPYTSKADIWSLGVIMYEMLYGKCPFYSNSIAALTSKIEATTCIQFPSSPVVSDKTKHIIRRMLTKDYFRRISWIELFNEFLINPIDSSHSISDFHPQSFSMELKSNNIQRKCSVSIPQPPPPLMQSERYSVSSQPNQVYRHTYTDKLISALGKKHDNSTSALGWGSNACNSVLMRQAPKQSRPFSKNEDSRGFLSQQSSPQSTTNTQEKYRAMSIFSDISDPSQISKGAPDDSLTHERSSSKKKFESDRFMKYLNLVTATPSPEPESKVWFNTKQKEDLRLGEAPRRDQQKPVEDIVVSLERLHLEFLKIAPSCQALIGLKDVPRIREILSFMESIKNKLREAETCCRSKKLGERDPNNLKELMNLETMINFEIYSLDEVIRLARVVCNYSEKNKENIGTAPQPQSLIKSVELEINQKIAFDCTMSV